VPHNVDLLKERAPHIDATFITTAGEELRQFSHPGHRITYIPNPIDPSIETIRCHERTDQPNDVFWACRGVRANFENNPRIEIPLFIEQSKQVKLDYHGMNGKAELFGAAYYEAIGQAKMGLNLTAKRADRYKKVGTNNEVYLHSSDRIAQYMGCGLTTFSTRDHGLEALFPDDKAMVFFSSKEELLEKLVYYKNHEKERQAVGKAGWEISHQHFNVNLVARYMVNTTFQLEDSYNYYWPTTCY
jgi:hypothetical protein